MKSKACCLHHNKTFGDTLHGYGNHLYQVAGTSHISFAWFDASAMARDR